MQKVQKNPQIRIKKLTVPDNVQDIFHLEMFL
jgi:hypothetical protein